MMAPIDPAGLVPGPATTTAGDGLATAQQPPGLPIRHEGGTPRRSATGQIVDATAGFDALLVQSAGMTLSAGQWPAAPGDPGARPPQVEATARGNLADQPTAWRRAEQPVSLGCVASDALCRAVGAPSDGLSRAITGEPAQGEVPTTLPLSGRLATETDIAVPGHPVVLPAVAYEEVTVASGAAELARPTMPLNTPTLWQRTGEAFASGVTAEPERPFALATISEAAGGRLAPASVAKPSATRVAPQPALAANGDTAVAAPSNAMSRAMSVVADRSDITTPAAPDPETQATTADTDDDAARFPARATIDDGDGLMPGLALLRQTRDALSADGRAPAIETILPPAESAHSRANDPKHDWIDTAQGIRPVVGESVLRAVAHDTPTSRASALVSDQIVGEVAARAEVWTRDGRTDLYIRLEPPELGTVRLHLVAAENTVTARLVAADEAARQIIESQLHVLRESLANVGVTLERFDVAGDAGGSQAQWEWHQEAPMPVASGFRMRRSTDGVSAIGSPRTANRIDVLA